MNYKVTAPDGRVIIVEAPEGASDKDLVALARRQHPAGMAERADPKDPRLVKISPGQLIGEGLKRRSGDIGAMVGATVPWARGAAGVGARVLGAELGGATGQTIVGEPLTPGYHAASQILGEGVAKAVSPLASPVALRSFANRQVRDLGNRLKELVPAWSQLPASHQGVYEMAHGTGQRALSHGFETSMRAIKADIPETLIVHVPEAVETAGRVEVIGRPRNARALIDDLPGLRKTGGQPYRAALKALAEELPSGLSPELDAARASYRQGAGFIEFAEKGKFLYGERFDPAKAQAALDKFGKSLIGRGMDEIRAIIRGPGAKPIETTKLTPWSKRLYGAAAGEIAGGVPGAMLGGGWGAGGGAAAGTILGGAAGERLLPSATYRNVPLTPGQGFASRLLPTGVAQGAREVGRKLELPERWPVTVPTAP